MSIQLTKEEKKQYMKVIKEEFDKDKRGDFLSVNSLKIVVNLRKAGIKRHTISEMVRLVQPRVKQYRKFRLNQKKLKNIQQRSQPVRVLQMKRMIYEVAIHNQTKKLNSYDLLYYSNVDGTYHIARNRFGVDGINVCYQELITMLEKIINNEI